MKMVSIHSPRQKGRDQGPDHTPPLDIGPQDLVGGHVGQHYGGVGLGALARAAAEQADQGLQAIVVGHLHAVGHLGGGQVGQGQGGALHCLAVVVVQELDQGRDTIYKGGGRKYKAPPEPHTHDILTLI